MRVSAKADYACVAMVELAVRYRTGQPVQVNAIAQAGALAALADTEHTAQTRAINQQGLAFYEDAFRARGLEFRTADAVCLRHALCIKGAGARPGGLRRRSPSLGGA